MGISTIQSYCGAQIFEAVGLDPALVDRHFTGTPSRIGGVGIDVLAREALERHGRAYPRYQRDLLPVGGVHQWRRDGELHIWNPDTVALLQSAVRGDRGEPGETYNEFADRVNNESTRKAALRGLLKLRADVEPVPVEEVEPVEEIVKRFSTGAMSLGSISPESHEALAIAMNRLGGRSNNRRGRGGRAPLHPGRQRRPAPLGHQAGRLGALRRHPRTTLVNADQIQIKMAQGAKPGEGGQLPGHKVDPYIASLRYSTPGVGLISPPPHHDIYSIEDLKQLIYESPMREPLRRDLGQARGRGRRRHGGRRRGQGGRRPRDDLRPRRRYGASPQSSIQAAGVPWEIGLAETQQTLLLNDLRLAHSASRSTAR